MQHRFVVITPVYISNGIRLQKFLKCLESVQHQSYRNFLHVIVDDGSSFEGSDILFKQILLTHKNILIYHTQNQGVIGALTVLSSKIVKLLKKSDFVLRLNSDDLLPENALKDILKHIDSGVDVVCGGAVMFYPNWDRLEYIKPVSGVTNYQLWRYLVEHKPFPHLNLCWRSKFFKKYVSKLDPKILYSEDWEQAVMTGRGLLDSKGKYVPFNNITYLFRKEDSSLGWQQAMDTKGKIESYNLILKSQIDGFDYEIQSFLNKIRLIKIRLGLMLPLRMRNIVMPKFAVEVSSGDIPRKTIELIKRG